MFLQRYIVGTAYRDVVILGANVNLDGRVNLRWLQSQLHKLVCCKVAAADSFRRGWGQGCGVPEVNKQQTCNIALRQCSAP